MSGGKRELTPSDYRWIRVGLDKTLDAMGPTLGMSGRSKTSICGFENGKRKPGGPVQRVYRLHARVAADNLRLQAKLLDEVAEQLSDQEEEWPF